MCVAALTVSAQNYITPVKSDIIPPAPQSSRPVEYQMPQPSLLTGAVDLTIPLYTVACGDYSFPLYMQYHSNGIKVMDDPSPNGYGWSLMPALRATRTVLGRPDELFDYIPLDINSIIGDAFMCMVNPNVYSVRYSERYDSQHDIFSFALPDYTVTRVLDMSNGTPIFRGGCDSEYKVTADAKLDSITVTDGKGVKYIFGGPNEIQPNSDINNLRTSWALNEIRTPGGECIKFRWQMTRHIHSGRTYLGGSSFFDKFDIFQWWNSGVDLDGFNSDNSENAIFQTIGDPIEFLTLCGVDFPGGRVDIEYSGLMDGAMAKRMIVSHDTDIVKTADFVYDTFGCRLSEIRLSDEGAYNMAYVEGSNVQPDVHSQDWWGYYNAKNNSSLTPALRIKRYRERQDTVGFYDSYGQADRSIDATAMQNNMLRRITYPTGGYCEFEYEPHRFDPVRDENGADEIAATTNPYLSEGGGVRVKRILAHTGTPDSKDRVVEYEYSQAKVRNVPSASTFIDVCEAAIGLMNVDYSDWGVDYIRSVNIRPFSDYMRYDIGETPLWYETVTAKYSEGAIRYRHKEIIKLSNMLYTEYGFRTHGGLHKVFSKGPQMVSKETFAMENGVEKLVEKDSLTYEEVYNGVAAHGSQIVRRIICLPSSSDCSPDFTNSDEISNTQYTGLKVRCNPYEITPYVIVINTERLKAKSHTEYTATGPITTEQTYTYKGKSMLVKSVTTSTSDGTGKTTEVVYADDCDGPVEAQMRAANVVSVPVGEKTQKGDASVEYRVSFLRTPGGAFVPRQVATSYGSGTAIYSPRFGYNAGGRPIEAVDADGRATSWLWGYGNIYPVYKAEGLDYAGLCAAWPQARNNSNAETFSLPGNAAPVWSYRYRPLVGRTLQYEPWGTVTAYGYDSGNRLSTIHCNGELTARYNYHIVKDYSYVSEQLYCNDDSIYVSSTNFDGFGREVLSLYDGYRGAVYTEYDAMGRPWRKTPMLALDQDPDSADMWSVSSYEASPRALVESTMRAGGAWQSAGVRATVRRLVNTPTGKYACPRYTADANGITLHGKYAPGKLTVTESNDEDGRIVREFRDMDGLVVMTAEGIDGNLLCTRRVYDSYGRLCAVLPPDIADGSYTFDDDVMQNSAYIYRYDEFGRCVSSKIPGCDAALTRYSRGGRVIAEHTPGMASNRWLMHFYDRCGREVLTSITKTTEQRLQSVADSLPVAVYDPSASGSYSFTPPLPMDVGTPQKALYYDSYDFLGSVTDSLPAVTRSQRVIGLLTGERDYAATTAKTLTTAYGYNAEGRVAEKSEQTLNGAVHTAYTYDRRGNVLTERSVHTPRGQAPIVREVTTAYNAAGRVARRRVTENGSEAEMSFAYDDCGRLASERMSNGVTRRYTYNIHGWPELTETVVPVELQADKDSVVQILPPLSPSYYRRLPPNVDSTKLEPINPPSVKPIVFTKTYTDRLLYTDGVHPRYGGSPSARINSLVGRYDYSYDPHDRLLRAYYTPGEKAAEGEDFTVTYSYDELSRPTDVDRSGVVSVDADGVETFGMLDELTYRYGESGALESIEGEHEGEDYYGRPGFSLRDGTYTWNNAGCMKSDSSRGIIGITYDYRNLPVKVQFSDGRMVTNVYNASGVLLRSTVYLTGTLSGKPVLTTKPLSSRDYIADRVFNKGKLEYSYFPGGYFDGTGGVHYLHSDYQGSVVMVTDSIGRVEQHNTYYPYGEPHRLPSGQPILYGGKEREAISGEYNYDARRLYSAGLLMTTPDPAASATPGISPYVFCAANPIRYIDITGCQFTDGSLRFIDMYLEEINSRIEDAQMEIDKNTILLASGGLSEKKARSAQKAINKAQAKIRSMNEILAEIDELKNSSQVYDVSIDKRYNDEVNPKTDNGTGYERSGVTFDEENGVLKIILNKFNLGNLAHELKHAYQFENGELSFSKRELGIPFYDLYDERRAYARGAIFGQRRTFSIEKVYNLQDVDASVKNSLPIQVQNSPQLLQGTANTFKAVFRWKGITYVGEGYE